MKLNGCNLVNYLKHDLVNDLVIALACPFGGPIFILHGLLFPANVPGLSSIVLPVLSVFL